MSFEKIPVCITKCSSYDEAEVVASLDRIFSRLGGLESFVKKGSRILVKPNLLSACPPSAAVTTHPVVVKSIVKKLLACGAKVAVGDSPTVDNFAVVMEKTGLTDALSGLEVEFCEFKDSKKVAGRRLDNIEIAAEIDRFDGIVNAAKLKTHIQMLLTLAAKNMFGCVVGKKKLEWHAKAGVNRHMFAKMLVDVHCAAKPLFNIVDGILAMEGNGPGVEGTPRKLDLLAGSVDAFALDLCLCEKLGVDARTFYILNAAREMGVGQLDHSAIDLSDDSGITVDDFKLPKNVDSDFLLPRFLVGVLKKWLVAKPEVDGEKCVSCGVCSANCPMHTMEAKKAGMAINHSKCIRCFCCMEFCPEAAIHVRRPLLLKALVAIKKSWRNFRRKK